MAWSSVRGVAGVVRHVVREANAGSAALIRANRPWDDDGPLHWRPYWGGPLLAGRYLPPTGAPEPDSAEVVTPPCC